MGVRISERQEKEMNCMNSQRQTENKFFLDKLVQIECAINARGRVYEGRPPPT
jgi:hypothetical protein